MHLHILQTCLYENILFIKYVPSIFRGNEMFILTNMKLFISESYLIWISLPNIFLDKFFHKALKQVWHTVILDYDENPLNILNSLTMINKAIHYFKYVIIKNDLLLSITLRAIDMNGVFCFTLSTTLQYG